MHAAVLTPTWSKTIAANPSSAPVIDGAGTISIAAVNNTIYSFDSAGNAQPSLSIGLVGTGHSSPSAPIVGNGALYIGTSGGGICRYQ